MSHGGRGHLIIVFAWGVGDVVRLHDERELVRDDGEKGGTSERIK
jgi:hypothetical protein